MSRPRHADSTVAAAPPAVGAHRRLGVAGAMTGIVVLGAAVRVWGIDFGLVIGAAFALAFAVGVPFTIYKHPRARYIVGQLPGVTP